MSEPIEKLLARKGRAARIEAVRQLRLLPPENALRLVVTVLVRVLRAGRRADRIVQGIGWLLACLAVATVATQQFGAALFLMLLLAVYFSIPLTLWQWHPTLWTNGCVAALDLVERADRPTYCAMLLDLRAAMEDIPRGWKGNTLRAALDNRLVRLLPRLEPDEAALLTPEQRAELRRMLDRLRHDPDACIAILLALGTAHDREAQTDARLLVVKHPSERVRAAARECLIALGERR